jgi:hypothetical protein
VLRLKRSTRHPACEDFAQQAIKGKQSYWFSAGQKQPLLILCCKNDAIG